MIQVNTEPSSGRNSREGVETTKAFQNGRRVGCLEVILDKQREGTINLVYDIVRTARRRVELSRNILASHIVTSNNIVILIEDKEIAQASSDLLDEKFQDGLEAILRREDLITRALLTRGAASFNDLVLFTNFTPSVLTTMRSQVNRWGTPAATLTIAWDIWDDIIADSDFVQWWDQVHKHELILEGRLGSILGMEIITDGYRYPTLQVLSAGECFVTASPITLGTITQRKELDSLAIDQYNMGRPARGWFLEQIQGQVLGNGRAVTRGTRV